MSHYTLEAAVDSDLILKIAMGRVPGFSRVHKFGSTEVGNTTLSDIWGFDGNKVYSTVGVTNYIWSTNNADNTEITVSGIDENWNLQTQLVTLQGNTAVAIPGSWLRIFRARNETPAAFAGEVYISKTATAAPGVPLIADAEAHVVAITQGTLMSHFTVPAGYTGFVYSFSTATTKGKDVRAYGFHRDFGGVFNAEEILTTYEGTPIKALPWLGFTEKSDFVVRGSSDVSNTFISATYDLLLVKNDPHLEAV